MHGGDGDDGGDDDVVDDGDDGDDGDGEENGVVGDDDDDSKQEEVCDEEHLHKLLFFEPPSPLWSTCDDEVDMVIMLKINLINSCSWLAMSAVVMGGHGHGQLVMMAAVIIIMNMMTKINL